MADFPVAEPAPPESVVSDGEDTFFDAPTDPQKAVDGLIERLNEWISVTVTEACRRYSPSKWVTYAYDRAAWVAKTTSLRQGLEAVAALGAIAYAAYNSLTVLSALNTAFFGTQPTGESNTTRNVGARKGKRNKPMLSRARARAVKTGRFKIEASVPNMDAYLSVVKRNTYLVSVRGHTLGSCLFFSKDCFMWPQHFSDRIFSLPALVEEEDDDHWEELVTFSDPISTRTAFVLDFSRDIDYCSMNEGYDMSLCHVRNNKVRPHKDIRKMFLTTEEVAGLDAYYDVSMMLQRSRSLVGFSTRLSLGAEAQYDFGEFKYSSRGMSYSAPTQDGDCGTFLMVNDPRLGAPRIFGIHTAGNRGGALAAKICLGVAVFEDELNAFVNSIRDPSDTLVYDEEGLVGEVTAECGDVPGFKVVALRKQPREPTRTKIVKSQLAPALTSVWPPTTKPAHLQPFKRGDELVDPRSKAREAYSHDEVYIDSYSLALAKHYVTNCLIKRIASEPHAPRVFCYEDAVRGIVGLDYVDPVNRSTSPGYPYCLENAKFKGKQRWLGSEDEVDFDSPDALALRARVEEIVSRAASGTRMDHIFVDVLKDERRPIEKVELGKTRQIMTCPMDLLIAMKMYFGDFVRHIIANRIQSGIAVGIDPFSEWTTLARFLQASPDHVFTAGDYSRYDGKIPVPIGIAVLDIIEAFYAGCPPVDTQIRFILFQEVINSRHLATGLVYECYGGNPSGQPLTSIFNSVANLLILSYTAYRVGAADVDGVAESLSRTRFQVFGDDNIVSYHPADAHLWDQQVLEAAIPRHVGMDYTNEHKDELDVSARPLTAISFLKRGFRFDRGEWLCPLELGVLQETLSWERDGATRDQLIRRIEATLSELARHGMTCFGECAPHILSASRSLAEYDPQNCSYELARASGSSLAI
jgi:hypothetical protein